MMTFAHTPVLYKEVMEGLRIRPEGIYVDGTLGGGGHAEGIAKLLSGKGRLIGIDRDSDALEAAGERLRPYGERVIIVKGNHRDMASILSGLGIDRADGILLDLGVSSHQLDDAGRGFSYREEAPLDMRMDTDQELTAADVVNTYSAEELTRIFREYSEERYAVRIAGNIVRAREKKPIRTTTELADIVKASVPARMRENGHPARKSFQAIRIEVNGELDHLEDSIASLLYLLNDGGRLCVISFHSLEDRMVKRAMKKAENPCICPKDAPYCVCGRKPLGKVITRKAVMATAGEIEENYRAHSAKLRIFERSMQTDA